MKKKRIVALLTGRGNSTLLNKNILPVFGKPLLYYPAMAAKTCDLITDFYVSSNDEKILKAAENCGYKRIVRPEEYSTPTAQHKDVILHALEVMKEDGINPDILIVLMANSGVVKKEWIEDSIKNILENEDLSASAPVKIDQDHHPYRAKKLREDGCIDTWFDFSKETVSTNRQDLPGCYYLCHNFWTLNVEKSIKAQGGQQPWGFMGNNVKPIIVEEGFDVHILEDIQRTEKWIMGEGIKY
ncbi:acylneuraminate cytidylyltransferase family protein [Flavisericum labens]|uniref:acylneuraminate cytidylyltransferase family protein n=1 Tax=Flavisericum labens TaxID=3377112 RepID=UPI00387B61CD